MSSSSSSAPVPGHRPTRSLDERWERRLRRPRIHIFRSEPVNHTFGWLVDYTCPAYQILDPRTNMPMKNDFSRPYSRRRSYDFLCSTFLEGDLSRFDPHNQADGRIPPREVGRLRFLWGAATLGYTRANLESIDRILCCPMYGPNARFPLKSVEYVFDSLERILEGFDSVFVNIDNYQNTMEVVKKLLGGPLEEYVTEFPFNDKERERREGLWREMTRLQMYFEEKNRVLLRYAGPGSDLIQAAFPTAGKFRMDQTEKAKKRFWVAPERDLVYIADPSSPELFLRLWKSPWCRQVRFMAILIGDYTLKIRWRETDLSGKTRTLWPNEPGIFERTELRQVMLVVRPPEYLSERMGAESSLSRDAYGFVRYGFCSRFFTDEHREVLGRQFQLYETQIRSMFPENARIRINHEIDIDCRSVGLDRGEIPIYSRTQRPAPPGPWSRTLVLSLRGSERVEN